MCVCVCVCVCVLGGGGGGGREGNQNAMLLINLIVIQCCKLSGTKTSQFAMLVSSPASPHELQTDVNLEQLCCQ